MTRRIGLYSPKIKMSEEHQQMLIEMYPRPEVDIERELGQLAIIKGVLGDKYSNNPTVMPS